MRYGLPITMRFPFNDQDGDITRKYANRSVGLYESVQTKGLPDRKLRRREPGAPQDGVQPPAAASVERDADPLFPAPDDATRPFQLLARTTSVKRSGINSGVT